MHSNFTWRFRSNQVWLLTIEQQSFVLQCFQFESLSSFVCLTSLLFTLAFCFQGDFSPSHVINYPVYFSVENVCASKYRNLCRSSSALSYFRCPLHECPFLYVRKDCPGDTRRKFNYIRRSGDVFYAFNLRPLSSGCFL